MALKKLIGLLLLLPLTNLIIAQTGADYNKSGKAKYFAEDYPGAIQDYTKAIQILSDTTVLNVIEKTGKIITLSIAYCGRANAKVKTKDYQGAMQDYNVSIEIFDNESFHHTYYNRGFLKLTLEDYRGAILDLNKAIELTPKFGNAYYVRGDAKYVLGKFDEACLDWSKAGELGISTVYEKIKEFCNQ